MEMDMSTYPNGLHLGSAYNHQQPMENIDMELRLWARPTAGAGVILKI